MSIQEKRRAAFEAWWASKGRQVYVGDTKCHCSDFIDGLSVWNAALDSVAIELPDVREAKDIAYFDADVRDAIESAGLKVRV